MDMVQRYPRTPRGFTLIEVIVVITIIGLLVGIALPAVQAAREAARRSQCVNNLKQIGIGLSGFHAANSRFPFGMEPNIKTSAGQERAHTPLSVHGQILGYIEQGVLYNQINHNLVDGNSKFRSMMNRTASSIAIDVFVCPSDRAGLSPGNNYRATVGPLPGLHDGTPWPGGGGAFPGLRPTSAQSFSDGLSHTVGFSERTQGSSRESSFDRRRDIWYSGISAILSPASSDEMMDICGSLKSNSPPAWTRMGMNWITGRYADTMYNHVCVPNWNKMDCAADYQGTSELGGISGGAITARSAHPGGVHTLMMDGSVHFVSERVSAEVWRAIASRNGGEAISIDF